jgi:hypothetical protein
MTQAVQRKAEAFRRAGLKLGDEHDVVVLPIEDLRVHLRSEFINDQQGYQRQPRQRRIDLIARNYDMSLAGVVEVSLRRNGEMFVFDGWHRVLAANIAGEEEILAHVHYGLSVQEEAGKFREMNRSRLGVSALQEFGSALTEEHPKYVEIASIVDHYGGRVAEPDVANSGGTGGIVAVRALETVYDRTGGMERGGADGLRRVLSIIRDGFGVVDHTTVQEVPLKGLSHFTETYSDKGRNPAYDRKQLVTRVGATGVEGLIGSATQLRAMYRGSLWMNFFRATVIVYNNRRSTGRLSEPS